MLDEVCSCGLYQNMEYHMKKTKKINLFFKIAECFEKWNAHSIEMGIPFFKTPPKHELHWVRCPNTPQEREENLHWEGALQLHFKSWSRYLHVE